MGRARRCRPSCSDSGEGEGSGEQRVMAKREPRSGEGCPAHPEPGPAPELRGWTRFVSGAEVVGRELCTRVSGGESGGQ